MKKIIACLVMLLVGISHINARPGENVITTKAPLAVSQQRIGSAHRIPASALKPLDATAMPITASRRVSSMHATAPTKNDLLGAWTLEGYDTYGDYQEIEFEILEGEHAGSVILRGFLNTDVGANYDATNAELTIPYQIVGYDDLYGENIYFGEIIEYDGYVEATRESIVVSFNGETLEFAEDIILGTFGEDPNEGFYSLVQKLNVFKGLNWEVLGEAEYLDFVIQSNVFNFIEPLEPVMCELRRSKREPNHFRLIDPWAQIGAEGLNLDIIYLLDGDMVVIPEVNFGQYDLGLGSPVYVIMSSASYMDGVLYGGQEIEDGDGNMTTLPTPREWLANPENEGLNITCKDYVVRPDAGKAFGENDKVGSILTYLPGVGAYYGRALDGYIKLPENAFLHPDEPDENDCLTAGKICTTVGSTIEVPVGLINETSVSAFQCDIVLPAGVSMNMIDGEPDVILSDRASRSHNLSSSVPAENLVRVLCYSSSSAAFKGSEGDLFFLKLIAAEEAGTYSVTIKDIVLTDCDGTEHHAPDVIIPIEVIAYQPGDANGDGTVNVSDIVYICNKILGTPAANFVDAAADVNKDGVINVTDVVLTVNMILSGGSKAPAMRANDSATLYIPAVSTMDETAGLDIVLDNPGYAVSALQFNLTLPEGVSLESEGDNIDCNLSNRATATHTMTCAKHKGVYTLVCYSSQSTDLNGRQGTIATLPIRFDRGFVEGCVAVDNVIVSDAAGNIHRVADSVTLLNRNAGIETVTAADNEVIYYNLSGVRVESPLAPGFYIEVSNGRVNTIRIR